MSYNLVCIKAHDHMIIDIDWILQKKHPLTCGGEGYIKILDLDCQKVVQTFKASLRSIKCVKSF